MSDDFAFNFAFKAKTKCSSFLAASPAAVLLFPAVAAALLLQGLSDHCFSPAFHDRREREDGIVYHAPGQLVSSTAAIDGNALLGSCCLFLSLARSQLRSD